MMTSLLLFVRTLIGNVHTIRVTFMDSDAQTVAVQSIHAETLRKVVLLKIFLAIGFGIVVIVW